MEIKLKNLRTDVFDVRDDSDEDNYEMLKGSLGKDGQWDPIMVRPGTNGDYEVISGHTRVKAAEDLGWDTIEANVKDVDDKKADELSLKTNLVRSGMSKVEEGRVLNHMINEYGITQGELADRLGKSTNWISSRIRMALKLHEDVQDMMERGDLSFSIARSLSSVDKSDQPDLAKRFLQEEPTTTTEANEIKSRYFNDTIYTIGYQGKDWDEFVSILKDNNVERVLDIRKSATSQYKPDFSSDRMESALADEGIDYTHKSELGVDYNIRQPYIDGYIDDEAFSGWYEWSLEEEEDIDVNILSDQIEATGPTALMCMEAHAKPHGDQDHHCHRDLLAESLRSMKFNGERRFPNREDL